MELRERLRALRTGPAPEEMPRVAASPLPHLQPLQNEHGCTYYSDKIYIDHHGLIDLKNFPELPLRELQFLSMDRSLNEFCLKDAVFLDIETTGTAGGTGTYAFLVGLGFVESGYFQVRQFFLHDLSQEAAFLAALAEFSARFRHIITYNGKCFDAQILRNRYLMHRREDPLADKQHIDMLFIARRLWKKRMRECDLMNLERNILQFYRSEDIPGYLIPSAYTDYLRYARGNLIQKVLHHNQWDIVSLAVLTARACMIRSETGALTPEEHVSLARLYERHREYGPAVHHYIQSLEGTTPSSASLVALARNLRRVRDQERMRWLVELAQQASMEAELCLRLSILCEHDLREPELALRFVDAQIGRWERFRGISNRDRHEMESWRHRRDRLLRKIARRASEPQKMLT